MRSQRLSGSVLLAALALLGCAHAEDPPEVAAGEAPAASSSSGERSLAQADDEAADSLVEHHRHHHHGGVTSFIELSLDTLGADPPRQDEVRRIQEELRAALAPARAVERDLIAALADGIEAGSIDGARVDAAIAPLAAAAGAAHDAAVDSLNDLHAVLTPVERATLVDKVRAHWRIWRQVNQDEQEGSREEGGRLASLAMELSLAPNQVENMAWGLRLSPKGPRSSFDVDSTDLHIEAFTRAFEGDFFDAKTYTAASSVNGDLATAGAMCMARFYETVNPFLTPEQRVLLAEHLREHLTHQQITAGK